jgi:Putative auto-transporter adhesin, head GIN domain
MSARAPRRATIVLAVVAIASTALLVGVAAGALRMFSAQAAPVQGQGQGALTSQDRTTTPFRRISVDVRMKVIVGTGSQTSVTVEAQPDLLPLITTEVRGDQLVVEVAPPGVSSAEPITLTVQMPELDAITLGEGAAATVEDMGGPLAVDVSAGATIIAIGGVESLAVTASGGAVAKLGDLPAGSAVVTLTGGSSAELHVTGAVTGTADAGSTLVLTQKPGSVDVKTTGGATVQGG